MKKKFFYSMLAAATMLVSCNSEDELNPEKSGVLENGEGYVSLAINLPSVSGSTRAFNDNFDDGTANEYAVKDAVLVLFEGANEAAATLSTAYNLNLTFNLEGTTTDNVTSTAQIVQKINDPLAASNNFYALVVLNNNGQFVVDASNQLTVNGASVAGKTLAQFITATKIDVTAHKLVDGTGVTAKDFFMSNAPLNSTPGGGTNPSTGAVTTLPEIDASKVYETAAEASANPATEICVERAVSKVTVTAANGTTTTNSLAFTILGWELDNTNTESYLVRNVDNFTADLAPLSSNKWGAGSENYRFVGSNKILTSINQYRTYWGIDPNYTGMAEGAGLNYWNGINAAKPAPTSWIAANGTPAYCAENTFDVDNQKDVNTTAVIIKAQFNGGTTFYTLNNNSASLYTATTLETAIKASFLGNTAIRDAINAIPERNTHVITATDLTLTYNHTGPGVQKVKEIVITGAAFTDGVARNASDITISSSDALELTQLANVIRCYENGVSYYRVLLKHFGDELTPWRDGETVAPTAGDIYPSANATANYLGRYGVLRNNWYDVQVTAVKNLGIATVPQLGHTFTPDTPGDPDPNDPDEPGDGGYDDDIDEYISVKINILSWAKRLQSVVL